MVLVEEISVSGTYLIRSLDSADSFMTASDYTKIRRQRHVKAGLTIDGKDRTNKSHPDLKGLSGADYHLAYMRKQRRQDREAWGQT